MIVKFLIILAIVVGGGILLYPHSFDSFPNDVDEAKDELTSFKDEAVENFEDTLNDTVEKITTTIDNTMNGFFVKPN